MKMKTGDDSTSMVEYFDSLYGNGDTGQDYETHVGSGIVRYGRRIFEWDERGFEDVEKFEDIEGAKNYVAEWVRDRMAPDAAFATRRVVAVDLTYFGLEGMVEYRNWPYSLTVNIYLNGKEVDVFTLGEKVDSIEQFEIECRDHFAHSDFLGEE